VARILLQDASHKGHRVRFKVVCSASRGVQVVGVPVTLPFPIVSARP